MRRPRIAGEHFCGNCGAQLIPSSAGVEDPGCHPRRRGRSAASEVRGVGEDAGAEVADETPITAEQPVYEAAADGSS